MEENPPELRLRDSEPLRAVLARVLRQDQVKEQAALVDVDRVWQAVLGAQAVHSRPCGLRDGVLHVIVDSAAALYELRSFREPEVLARLRQELPQRVVRRLKLKVRRQES